MMNFDTLFRLIIKIKAPAKYCTINNNIMKIKDIHTIISNEILILK